MIKILILIFSLTLSATSFGKNEIEYQNKRLVNKLEKNGISGFSKLREIYSNSEGQSEQIGKFFEVENDVQGSNIKYVFVGRVNSCRAGGCCNTVELSGNGESEYFDYFIFFDLAKTVQLVEVYNYQATHGYEITAKGWLKQFIGFSEKDTLQVNKDIDGISGATISVFAITADVQAKTQFLETIN